MSYSHSEDPEAGAGGYARQGRHMSVSQYEA